MLLYGCGGHSKVVADCLSSNNIKIEGIFDDKPYSDIHYGLKVIGFYQEQIFPESPVIISVGANEARKILSSKIKHIFGKINHPSALISPSSQWNTGTVVFHRSVIQADTYIGYHSIINTGAVIEHDCVLEDFVHISPHSTICGGVHIGEGTWVGAGATVMQGIEIGNWCVIAAGSVVVKDVPDYSLVMGVPGVIVKNLKSSEI